MKAKPEQRAARVLEIRAKISELEKELKFAESSRINREVSAGPEQAKLRVGNDAQRDGVVAMLISIGEDADREGLKATPHRVRRLFREMTEGYKHDPRAILSTVFKEDCDQVVVVRGIRFSSLCEHHLLPFTGTVNVGYLPKGSVVGLSKIPRLVECFARRLQVQERMTREVAEALHVHLNPEGVGVVVTAHHHCMGCRGVRQPDAEMVTSVMLGAFRESAEARAELLSLFRG